MWIKCILCVFINNIGIIMFVNILCLLLKKYFFYMIIYKNIFRFNVVLFYYILVLYRVGLGRSR